MIGKGCTVVNDGVDDSEVFYGGRWEYRVVGFNLVDDSTQPVSSSSPTQFSGSGGGSGEGSQPASPLPGLSREFLESQFQMQQMQARKDNTAYQIQRVLNIYGRRGWLNYEQGFVGPLFLLSFRRQKISGLVAIKEEYPLTPEEAVLLQKLDSSQLP